MKTSPIYFDSTFDLEDFLAHPPPFIALDCETNLGTTRYQEIITVGMSWATCESEDQIRSVCFHVDLTKDTDRASDQLSKILKHTLFNPQYKGQIIFHNVDFDLPLFLFRYFISALNYNFRISDFCKIYDTAALSRVLDNRKYIFHADEYGRACHSLKYLTEEYLGIHYGDVVGRRNTREILLDKLVKYNIEDVIYTLRLFFLLRKKAMCLLGQWEYFENVEMPFLLGIVGLNWRGVGFDAPKAKRLANLVMRAIGQQENRLAEGLGRKVNIQSKRELIAAFIRNPNLCVLKKDKLVPVSLPFITEKGQPQVDIYSFQYLRDQISETDSVSLKTKNTLNCLIICMELWQAYGQIEMLQKHARKRSDGFHRIYARYSVDARTGRVKCGSPNVQGISSEIFNESEIDETDSLLLSIKNEYLSVRSLLVAGTTKQKLISIDISGLDLGVIAAFLLKYDENSYWAQCFRKYSGYSPDTHYSILQKVFPEEFMTAFSDYISQLGSGWNTRKLLNYWITKEENGIIVLINRNDSNEIYKISTEKVQKSSRIFNSKIRGGMKTGNLAVSYGQSALQYALGLMDALKRPVSEEEAQNRLDRFMETFPELVKFKDEVMNSVYANGYLDTPFGRRIYSDVWTELNQSLQYANEKSVPDIYEFIVNAKCKYWYIKAENWGKTQSPVVENLKPIRKRNLLSFKKLHMVFELPSELFTKKKNPNFSKWSRKTELNHLDQSKFEKDIFEISNEIHSLLKTGIGWEPEAESIALSWKKDGLFHLPAAKVLFYKVDLPTTSARYFHAFKGFGKVAKSFFAIYCQAVAAIVAKKTFNEIQKNLESATKNAYLVQFPHDQFVVEACETETTPVIEIMKNGVQSNKGLFPENQGFEFSGEIEGPSSDFSFNKE